jgi:hypothetical protein
MINPFDPFVADKLGLSTKNEITWSDSGSDDQSQNNEAPVPTIVTALCCVGGKPLCSNSNPTPLPSLSPFSVNSMSKISGALFIGVGVIDAIASHVKKAPLVATDSTESLSDVSVLNRVNDSMISDTCPRIAEQSASNELRRRPFIFVYHIAESISATDIEQPPFKFIDTDDELDQICKCLFCSNWIH